MAIRDETIRKLIDLGELSVFKAYRRKWNKAAEVIVPIVQQVQTSNGIKPYTRDEYTDEYHAK